MPYYQNSLYGRGVPSYAEQLSPLADVFKAFAPNPLRDIQVQGYASRANLANLKGQQISRELAGADSSADAFDKGDTQGALSSILRGGNPQTMTAAPKFFTGAYGLRGIDDPNSVNQSALADAVVGVGGNYKNTAPGFEADQSRQLQQNENTNAARRYGSELQAGVGHEGNRMRYDASIYGADQRAEVGHEGNQMRYDASTYGADQRAGATRYGADQSRLAREFDTKNDIRKTTSGGGRAALANKVDPVKIDNAVMQSLPGSFKDAKGRWQVDPSITPADLAEVRTRVAARVQANPADQYGAVQQAIAEVYGTAPVVNPETEAEDNWGWDDDVEYAPSQVVSLPQAQRPPRPSLGQQFAAPPVSAPAVPSMPNAPVAAAPNADVGLAKAAAAIQSGAPRDAVVARLRQAGYSEQAIQQAGI